MAEVATVPLVYHYGDSFLDIDVEWQSVDGEAHPVPGYLASMKVRSATDNAVVLWLDSDTHGGLLLEDADVQCRVRSTASPALMLAGDL